MNFEASRRWLRWHESYATQHTHIHTETHTHRQAIMVSAALAFVVVGSARETS